MCGLAGRLDHTELDPHAVELLLFSLRRRPDGLASKAWPEATLLDTRLRIIDLSPTGDQPMANEDGSVWRVRRLAEEKLPAGVAGCPKQGFEVPVDRWVDTAFKENLREGLFDRQSPVADHFDRREYDPWVHSFCNGDGARQMSRERLDKRVIMLLSLGLALRNAVNEVGCAR
jgi:asparagine synthetase B (glutamine-hydrolysing)